MSTPLETLLRAQIRRTGPMRLDTYMAQVLGHPEYGYYTTRDPLGLMGDFTTSPEISQVFGEILGLWLADRWLAFGRPDPVNLVELGPGRGSLMADLLRALSVVPDLRRAVRVQLIETSPVLRERQRSMLAEHHPDQTIVWHDRFDDVLPGAVLLVANEFFDALPIRQFVRRGDGWHERQVALDADDQLGWAESAGPVEVMVPPDAVAAEGDIYEVAAPAQAIATRIGARLGTASGAALIVDYGHGRARFGDTLQAVRRHRATGVFDRPGEADLTAHVDFAALATAIEAGGGRVVGIEGQGRFLIAHGAAKRETALTRGATPAAAASIRGAIARLIDPRQMGALFKVLAAVSPRDPMPPGFRPWP